MGNASKDYEPETIISQVLQHLKITYNPSVTKVAATQPVIGGGSEIEKMCEAGFYRHCARYNWYHKALLWPQRTHHENDTIDR